MMYSKTIKIMLEKKAKSKKKGKKTQNVRLGKYSSK